jgi:hypothetical protein
MVCVDGGAFSELCYEYRERSKKAFTRRWAGRRPQGSK